MLERGKCRRFRRSAVALGLTVLLLPLAVISSVADPPKPALKSVDVFDLQWVADPQISPNGRRIAYVRMSMDIKTDRPR